MCGSCGDAKLVLPYIHIRGFVVAYMYQLRMNENLVEDADFTKSTLEMVRLQSAAKVRTAPMIPGDKIRTLIHVMTESLQQVLDHSIEQTEAVIDSQGNGVVADSLPKVFEKWGNTFDVEMTKMYAAQVFRYVAFTVLPRVNEDLHKALKDRIAMLKDLVAGLGEDADRA
jgi:hypothetical protein